MSPEHGIGFTDKGSVVLLSNFLDTEIGRSKLQERAAYLWLAQQANHPPQPVKLDGTTITVQRGEWFGSHKSLSEKLGVAKKTLMRILSSLTVIGAVTVAPVERPQRYKKGTVNGGENEPLKGGKMHPQGGGNRTDVRCLGTLVKVHGWKDFRTQAPKLINGGNFTPQVSTTATVPRVPRLTAAQRAVNDQASAVLRGGGL